MGRPMDAAAAFIDKTGNLNVVEGRGGMFVFDPAKNPKGPQSFESAFARGEKVFVIDSGKKSWAYSLSDGTWTPGTTMDAGEGEENEAWKNMGNMMAVGPPAEPSEDEE